MNPSSFHSQMLQVLGAGARPPPSSRVDGRDNGSTRERGTRNIPKVIVDNELIMC